MSHQVPPKGSAVFAPVPGDKRPSCEFRVGNRIIVARMPGPASRRPWQEPVPEIIDMATKPFSKKQYPDPYHLDG